jgi:uncharacterized protein
MQLYLQKIFLIIISLFFIFTAPLAFAVDYPKKPANSEWYVDEANLISFGDKSQIDKIAGQLWQEKHIPILVVTISSLAAKNASDTTVDSYTRSLFSYWGVGSQKNNNGILFLISKGDKHARIEMGAEWGHSDDQATAVIMNNDVIPQFKTGNFSGGILNGVIALDKMARGSAPTIDSNLPASQSATQNVNTAQPPSTGSLILMGIAFLAIIGIIFSLFRSGRSGWAWAAIIGLGLLIWAIFRNTGGGGGGSNDSFGGGSSDGGGSSGSW